MISLERGKERENERKGEGKKGERTGCLPSQLLWYRSFFPAILAVRLRSASGGEGWRGENESDFKKGNKTISLHRQYDPVLKKSTQNC